MRKAIGALMVFALIVTLGAVPSMAEESVSPAEDVLVETPADDGATGSPEVPQGSGGETSLDVAADEGAEAEEAVVPGEEAPGEPSLEAQASDDAAATTASETAQPSLRYTAHVQKKGWMKEVGDGAVGGTTGKGLRVEAIKIRLDGSDVSGGIEYRMHVQKHGWKQWARDGAVGGTTKKGLRVEAFRLRLYGDVAERYDVWYRVHVQSIGWMAWTSNGELAGTTQSSLRVEAFQMLLAPKGERPADLPQSDVEFAYAKQYVKGSLRARAHVQKRGWLSWVGSGQTIGTTGSGLRVEGLRLSLSNYPAGITYRAHVQREGWQSWRSDGELAGTMGKGRRIEALQVKLYGDAADAYDVYYRTHVQGIGWMAWAKNGATAGTLGLSLRVEALQVRLVPKGTRRSELPSSAYQGAAVDSTVTKPAKLEVKLIPQLAHGYKSPYYQRCIVMHDTTENRGFDYWIQNWIDRGGSGTQFMVNEQGQIRQYVDMNQICWHAGGPTYSWLDQHFNVVQHTPGAGSAMNQCSIGIEIDHVEDGRPYPAAQLDAIDRLVDYIDRYYGFEATILQHKDYRLENSDCSDEFQGYLKHLQRHRTTR